MILILLLAALSQNIQLPGKCKPGDLMEGYGRIFACVASNEWKRFKTLFDDSGDLDTEPNGKTGPMPSCAWAFYDVNDDWHCPYETATGKVVSCLPCPSNNHDCLSWFAQCQKRVMLMRHYRTVEPTIVKLDPEEITDHTTLHIHACPAGFSLQRIDRSKFICIGDK